MGMFDKYQNQDQDYIPDNIHKHFPRKGNSIVSGGTNLLIFSVPEYYYNDVQRISIIFNQEEKVIMVKNPSSLVVDGCFLYIECSLSSTESLEFGHTYLDTLVQLKFEYVDRTLYTEVEKIKVINTLDNDGPAPDVPVMVGFGYTED